MKCPICKDIMMFPRLYPQCGHTICEPCMIKNDKVEHDSSRSIFLIPNYSCPICRQKTIIAWYARPINRVVLEHLRQDNEYEEKYNKYINSKDDPNIEIPEKLDLSRIVIKNRREKVQKIYKDLLPILFEAASKGQPFIITNLRPKDIQMVADLLAEKLFKNNNIYRLACTPRDCTIELIPSSRTYKTEYINPALSSLSLPSRTLPAFSRRLRNEN